MGKIGCITVECAAFTAELGDAENKDDSTTYKVGSFI